MTVIENFHFIRPLWLLLIPLALWVWWLKRKSDDPVRGWRTVMDRDLLAALAVGQETNNHWRGVGLLAGWMIALIAIAGPTWRPEPSPFADDPVPVMVLLKADQTMDIADLVPNRMERARLKVADFATGRKGQPLGLIAYAGSAHLVLPPTRDTSIVATMAAELGPTVMPKTGDDLCAALELATKTLSESGGSVVVVADTVAASNVKGLAEFHKDNQLAIHFLAVARANTPEWDAVNEAATAVHADATLMTPDESDIQTLLRRTADAPVPVSAAAEGTRWAETGWWLVPLLALLSLASFRRTQQRVQEATS